jgi:hypothetical protein
MPDEPKPAPTASIVPAPAPAPKPELSHVFAASCVGGDAEMAKRLSRFPSLVHAPDQHGEGIRTHMKGASVEAIAKSATAAGLYKALDNEAAKHGVDLHELCDALRFARAEKMV